MDTLLQDLWHNITTYYDSFVALLPKLGLALLVVIVLLFVANTLQRFSQNRLVRRMDDPLLARFIGRLAGTTVVIVALLLALRIVGLGGIAVGLLSTAGVGAFVIGFAFKDIGENFLAGVVLAFKRPFRVGDTVELNGFKGRVVALNLRDTQIKSSDGRDIFIPNANVIKNAVVNFTVDGFLRQEFTITLDHNSNVAQAVGIIQRILDQDPGILHIEGRKPDVVYGDLTATTLNINAQYWIDTFDSKVPSHKLRQRLIDKTLSTLQQMKAQNEKEALKTMPDEMKN